MIGHMKQEKYNKDTDKTLSYILFSSNGVSMKSV